MLIKARYLGFYTLGSEIEINSVPIMKHKWDILNYPYLVFGNHHNINVFGSHIYFVKHDNKVTVFTALEYGVGQYHIFTFSEKIHTKIIKHIK